MALGIAALDLNPSYRICHKFALEMQNSENFSLKKCKWLYSMFSHMPKYPTCLRKRLVILQQKERCSFWHWYRFIPYSASENKGNSVLYLHCPHFYSSCWEFVRDSEEELSYFISNSAERKIQKFGATCCSCAQSYCGGHILQLNNGGRKNKVTPHPADDMASKNIQSGSKTDEKVSGFWLWIVHLILALFSFQYLESLGKRRTGRVFQVLHYSWKPP